jgi:hypothetical protein
MEAVPVGRTHHDVVIHVFCTDSIDNGLLYLTPDCIVNAVGLVQDLII